MRRMNGSLRQIAAFEGDGGRGSRVRRDHRWGLRGSDSGTRRILMVQASYPCGRDACTRMELRNPGHADDSRRDPHFLRPRANPRHAAAMAARSWGVTSASFFDSAISLRNSGLAIWSKSCVRFVPHALATVPSASERF